MNTNLEANSAQSAKKTSSASTSLPASDSKEVGEASLQAGLSADWNEHEHISAQVQLEAAKLVEMVGTPELAKQAINNVERNQLASTGDSELKDSLASSRFAASQMVATLRKSLEDLETSFATPVFPGELTQWVANALRACEQVRATLIGDIQNLHTDLFAGILRENINLTAQVDKLRTADIQIACSDCDELFSMLTRLLRLAESARQDEAKVAMVLADVIKQGMAFVVAARSQETAIAAWMSEAFNRDLGSGD